MLPTCKKILRYLIAVSFLVVFHESFSQAPVLSSYSPLFSSICKGGTGTLTANVTNNPTSFLWQISRDQEHWTTITDDQTFSGTSTATITITPQNSTAAGYVFRCFASNESGSSGLSNYTPIIQMPVSPPNLPVIKANMEMANEVPQTAICGGVTQSIKYRCAPAFATSTTWSYSGTTASTVIQDTLITLTFNSASTSGVLSMTASNGCGTGIPGTLSLNVNPTTQTTLAGNADGSPTCSYISTLPGLINNGFYDDNSCQPINSVQPTGNLSDWYKYIKSCVTVLPSIQTYNGLPYVQRYYSLDLLGTLGDHYTGGTATVTLYYTQSDFDNFNNARGILPPLPTGPSDAIGISNIRITQFHGQGSTPETFTGTSGEIDPTDDQIIWNSALSRWEITFAINGLSGFFLSTYNLAALPLKLISFTGVASLADNKLSWQTTSEINVSHFEITRSYDGNAFTTIASKLAFNSPALINSYSYSDKLEGYNKSVCYYRLKMVDLDGSYSYSKVINIQPREIKESIETFPNPILQAQQISVRIASSSNKIGLLQIKNIDGQVVFQQNAQLVIGSNIIKMNVGEKLRAGIYFLQIANDKNFKVVKIVKQ